MLRLAFSVLGLIANATPAGAWANHGLLTLEALSALPAGILPATVVVEELDAFLAADPEGLARELEFVEQELKLTAHYIPERPVGLKYDPKAPDAAARRETFLRALRLHPGAKLALAIQSLDRPGEPATTRAALPLDAVSMIPHSTVVVRATFQALTPGEAVRPEVVLASASDEPDFGQDLGLFTDNGTEHGKTYGFGPQPFGNPAYEFSSAAPFHMGFHHERLILMKAAPFLERTFSELRLAQSLALARFALKTGHLYWGYRFAGWGLHYAQDLAQPYHAAVFPGRSSLALIWVSVLDLLGRPKAKAETIQIVNNRHLALENYVYTHLAPLLEKPEAEARNDWAVSALRDTRVDADLPAWKAAYEREEITRRSYEASTRIDEILLRYLPERIVEDPDYVFGETDRAISIAKVIAEGPPAADHAMAEATAATLRMVGAHTRQFVRAAIRP